MRNYSLARNEILFWVFGPGVQKVAHPWSTVSKAFEKSKNTQQLKRPLSMFLINLSYNELIAKADEELGRNPN